jgi:hypothetical protein
MLRKNYKAFTQQSPGYPYETDGSRTLGFVYGTGGSSRVDNESRMPMDWGVISPMNDDRIWERQSELNKVCRIHCP